MRVIRKSFVVSICADKIPVPSRASEMWRIVVSVAIILAAVIWLASIYVNLH